MANRVLQALFLLLFPLVALAQPSGAPSTENLDETVSQLIAKVEHSELTFIRNADEHSAAAAADHMRQKYNLARSRIHSKEDFIREVASTSSLTGMPYLVKFPDGATRPLKDWLGEETKAPPDQIPQSTTSSYSRSYSSAPAQVDIAAKFRCNTDADCLGTKTRGCTFKALEKEFANVAEPANSHLCRCLHGPVFFGCVPKGSEMDKAEQ